jgi:hypothetical protein
MIIKDSPFSKPTCFDFEFTSFQQDVKSCVKKKGTNPDTSASRISLVGFFCCSLAPNLWKEDWHWGVLMLSLISYYNDISFFFVNTWWELGTLIVPLLQNYLEFSIALSSLIELLPTKCGNKLMKKSWTIGMKISHNLLICVCGGTCDSTLKVDKRSVVHGLELQQEKRYTVPYLTLHSWQIDSYHYRFPLVKEWCPSQQLSASILPRCSDHKD